MQSIAQSVGEGGANLRHDVALVQALLRIARRPPRLDPTRSTYLAVIDGDCGPRTRAALRLFQADQVSVGPDGRCRDVVAGATVGQVRPDDPTWRFLVAAAPAEYSDLRVLVSGTTVYLAAPAADLNAALAAATALTFEPGFGAMVQQLIRRIHQRHGIAIQVCRNGARRSFQTQYELLTSGRRVTQAGPGESNHNYGQAVDLGFQGLRWLRRDGTVVGNEDAWLHQLDPHQVATGEAGRFWDILRTDGAASGMHRGPISDRPHLQSWPDGRVDMAERLANLLTGSGRMRWAGRHARYQCDFGYGGRLFDVGRAGQIWSRQATVTAAMLEEARAVQVSSTNPSLAATVRATAPKPVTPEDVAAMRTALQADFVAADANWAQWSAQ